MKLTNPKKAEETIESPFASNLEASTELHRLLSSGDMRASAFASDILSASLHARGPSPSQQFWLHKLAMNVRPAAVSTETVNLSGITQLFTRAGTKLKRPAVVLALPDGDEMKVSVAGDKSRYAGQLMLAAPTFGGAYFGRVDQSGAYFAGRSATSDSLNLLRRFAADPLTVAREHGHLTGKCCFCNRKLDNETSTALGYGPVCAVKWGLDHSAKAARKVSALTSAA